MKYPLFIADASQKDHSQRTEFHTNNAPVVRRFPPVIQYLSRCEQFIEDQIQAVSLRAFKAGKSVDEICAAMYKAALSLGYIITIGVQEVYSAKMPSFPDQTIMSCLIMVDFTAAGEQARS